MHILSYYAIGSFVITLLYRLFNMEYVRNNITFIIYLEEKIGNVLETCM